MLYCRCFKEQSSERKEPGVMHFKGTVRPTANNNCILPLDLTKSQMGDFPSRSSIGFVRMANYVVTLPDKNPVGLTFKSQTDKTEGQSKKLFA